MNETTTSGPLTATVGERVGDDPHVQDVRHSVEQASGTSRPGRPARRPFPWGALALAAIGWALATGIGGRIRARARRIGRGARRLVTR